MGLIRNCRMMSRGDDWIKLLADVEFDGRIRDFDALKAEHDLIWHRLKISHPAMDDSPSGYGRPEVMSSGLWKDRVVFKFRIEPYSEKVNDLYQYIYDFGELADKRTERKAEEARFGESLRGISESIMGFAEKNCVDKDDKPFQASDVKIITTEDFAREALAVDLAKRGIKVPDAKIITMKELDGSGLQFVPNGADISPIEPGIRLGDRQVRSLASRFVRHGII